MIENRVIELEKNIVVRSISYKNNKVTYYTNAAFGDSTKETIVLLHPAFSDYRIFVGQFEAWEDKYNMIAIDMAGHGRNNALSNEVTMGDMPSIIEVIMNDHQISSVHLLGVSLGSLVAQGVADSIGDRVKSVTIVGGYSIHKDNKEIQKAQNKEKGKWMLMIIFAMNRFRSYVSRVSTAAPDSQYVFRLGADMFRRRSFVSMQGLDKLFRETEAIMPYRMLLIVGEKDLPLAINGAKHLNSVEPNSSLEIIEDAGHCANIDNTSRFNEVYERFIGI